MFVIVINSILDDWLEGFDTSQLCFLNQIREEKMGGHITMSPSGTNIFLDPELTQKGVIFTDIETAAQKHPEILEKILGQIVKFDEDKFTAIVYESFGLPVPQ